jgi:hypothetical protein
VTTNARMKDAHRWRFFRAGGFDQVKLDSGEDLLNLDKLDQKLWVALACPTKGLEIDQRMIDLIDTDKDGRIRVPELIAAVKFAGGHLKDPDSLFKASPTLSLSAINDSTPEGTTLVAAARRILQSLGKSDASVITIDDVSDLTKIFNGTPFNGDGVITALSTTDAPAQAVIAEVIDCLGGDPDRSGQTGIKQETVDAFFAEIETHAAWYDKSEANRATIAPLGQDATTAAWNAVTAIRTKIDDYFGRCRLAAFDARTIELLNRKEEEYLAVAAQDLTISAEEISGFPLAKVAAGKPLPLVEGVNPAHAAALATLRAAAIVPLLGDRTALSEADWSTLQERLAPHGAWIAEKPVIKLDRLGAARMAEIRKSGLRATLGDLIAQDKALEPEAMSVDNVERLVRYHRSLVLLCTNFVNFKDFYRRELAVFQAGTLYLDQRSCALCLPVDDAAKHATMAGLAGAYLAYCDCTRKSTGEKRQIVAAFTNGDSDNLMVGRNGVFYDRQGRDWDATITKILDNPISIREAFWAPYKKFVRLLEEQIAKRAAAADADSHAVLAGTATATVNVDKAKPPEPKKLDIGTVAALGVAVGAIGTFITALIGYATGVFKLGILPTIGAIIGIMLLISMPSVVLAYIKLRKRNLGPILDANGWAVNAKARINVPFGASLTGVAKLPAGARRDTSDPYADKGMPWKRVVFLVLLIYVGYRWCKGAFDRLLPEPAQARTVLGDWFPRPAPSEVPAPAEKPAAK